MLDKANLIQLAKVAINADSSSKVAYSIGEESLTYSQVNKALAKELRELAGTYSDLRENRNLIFSIIEQAIDDVLPNRVIEQYGQFAEIRTFRQGDRPVFYQKISHQSRTRARQFITKVGLAGRYEVFKLDGRSYEVATSAFGGAVQVAIEEVLDGRVTMADVLDIALEALDRSIYIEIERALKAGVAGLQAANKATNNTFVEDDFDRLIGITDAYGGNATIYCTFEFARTMLPPEGWVSEDMKNERWKNGYLGNYKGHRVIVLNQSFEDETNLVKVLDPAYCYIIPGGAEKPIKIALEGQTLMDARHNDDWSDDIHFYRKLGVAADMQNNMTVYINTSLKREIVLP